MTNDVSEPARTRILICEDDFGSRKILTKILNGLGEVHAAMNGREAVDAVEAAQETGDPYDIITLDLRMPEMDGQEALQLIRGHEERTRSSRSTILITTATDDSAAVCAAFREQCDGYLIKPIRKADILCKLAEFGFAGG